MGVTGVTETKILNKMINNDAKIPLTDHYRKKKVSLVECNTTGSQLEIFNLPEDSIVINLDSRFENYKLFEGSAGECKRSDYIIISESKNIAIFIEMKKGKSDTSKIIQQLKGSLCTYEYFQSIAREFFNKNKFLAGYNKRFVAFTRASLTKRKTKINKAKNDHSTPNQPMKISGAQNIQFNMIAT